MEACELVAHDWKKSQLSLNLYYAGIASVNVQVCKKCGCIRIAPETLKQLELL
jgi:hypothetical protein